MTEIVLGLGSNRTYENHSSLELLQGAVFELNKILKKTIFSSVYKTKAMYVENQDDFLNMTLLGYVPETYSAHNLLEQIHKIEASLGRDRSKEVRFGPRSIDIDIELFGKLQINDEDLEIPHPRLKERAFVLIPLLEILPRNAELLSKEKIGELEAKIALFPKDEIKKVSDAKDFFPTDFFS